MCVLNIGKKVSNTKLKINKKLVWKIFFETHLVFEYNENKYSF